MCQGVGGTVIDFLRPLSRYVDTNQRTACNVDLHPFSMPGDDIDQECLQRAGLLHKSLSPAVLYAPRPLLSLPPVYAGVVMASLPCSAATLHLASSVTYTYKMMPAKSQQTLLPIQNVPCIPAGSRPCCSAAMSAAVA